MFYLMLKIAENMDAQRHDLREGNNSIRKNRKQTDGGNHKGVDGSLTTLNSVFICSNSNAYLIVCTMLMKWSPGTMNVCLQQENICCLQVSRLCPIQGHDNQESDSHCRHIYYFDPFLLQLALGFKDRLFVYL